MADLKFSVAVSEASLTASTAKTLVAITAPGNQRVKILGFEIMGKAAAGGTDTPVKVELLIATGGISAGTPGSFTTSKLDGDMAETVQSTIGGNYSAEPTYTGGTTVRTWEVQPQTGLVLYFPLDIEMKLKGGTGFGLRLTSSASETVSVVVIAEE